MQLLSKSIGSAASKRKMMKAFVMRTPGETGMTEKLMPLPGPDDAIVRTSRALMCQSDISTVNGALGRRVNLTLGHEGAGIVHEVGENVRLFKAGDRVVAGTATPDWSDPVSQANPSAFSISPPGGWKFSNTKDGVLAEYFHVNMADANLGRIPESVSDDAAVYCPDTLSTGFMGAENAHIPVGGTVAVFGAGAVGLAAVAASRLLGAGMVISIDGNAERLELAEYYGADHLVDDSAEDPVRSIMDATGGNGVDASIEAVSSEAVYRSSARATHAGGYISNVGYHGEGDFLHTPREEWGAAASEMNIVTGLAPGGGQRLERLLRLIEMKRIDPTRMTTHTFSFDRVEEAYGIMDRKLEGLVKALVVFR